MNKYYNYDSMNMWDDSIWADRMGYTGELFKWITENYKSYYDSHPKVIDDSRWKDFNDPAYYSSNTCNAF